MPAFHFHPRGLWGRCAKYLAFPRDPKQIDVLDGLRALAICLVLIRHAYRPFEDTLELTVPLFGWDLVPLMANGWVGVDLFFVLSGFLITRHIINLNAKQGGDWHWRPYLAKRILRIVPAYYAVILLVVIGTFPHYPLNPEYLGLRIGYHLLFLQDYLPANLVVAFWSLGVEEKFYLLAPPLVLVLLRNRGITRRLCLLAAVLGIGVILRIYTAMTSPGIDDYEAFFPAMRSPFHLTLDPLLIGVALSLIYRERRELGPFTSPAVAGIVFLLGVLMLLGLTATHDMMATISWWDKTLQPLAIATAFGAITFGLLFGKLPARIMRSYISLVIARLSYCLYLVHMPLVPVSVLVANNYPVAGSVFVTFLAIYLSLSAMAAVLLHYGAEKPFLILKSRVAARPVAISHPEASTAISNKAP